MIRVIRNKFTSKFTQGIFYDDNNEIANTLEDPVRPFGLKIPDETAIPDGRYILTSRFSPSFNQNMLMLESPNMPNTVYNGGGDADFTYIYFHGGTRPEHSSGCILMPGWNSEIIYNSFKHQIGDIVEVINDFKGNN